MFEMLNKKNCANFQRIIELFTQKIVAKLSNIWVWDPGSRIRKKHIPDPGVKKAPDPGSGFATLGNSCFGFGSEILSITQGDNFFPPDGYDLKWHGN